MVVVPTAPRKHQYTEEFQIEKPPAERLVAEVKHRSRLENEAETKLDLPLRSQTVDPRAVADAEGFVVGSGRSVDRPSPCSEQNAVHSVRREIEVAEVRQVVKAHARFDGEAIVERVPPGQFQIQCPEPGEVHLPWRGQIGSRCNTTQLRDLSSRHDAVLHQYITCWRQLARNGGVVPAN